jgi:plastocyanin
MRRLVAAAAIGVLFASACSSGKATTSAGGRTAASGPAERVASNSVDLPKSYKYVPAAIVIDVGSTVTWTNHDDFPHTVTLADSSGVERHLGIGQSTTIAFDHPGTITYTCSLHPAQMRGSVLVLSEAS